MAYSKHTWTDDELITKEKLNNIENGIANIELTPGPAGPQGPQGKTGPQGPVGPAGAKGADAVIPKLDKIDDLVGEDGATLLAGFNKLLKGLKAKGYMTAE